MEDFSGFDLSYKDRDLVPNKNGQLFGVITCLSVAIKEDSESLT